MKRLRQSVQNDTSIRWLCTSHDSNKSGDGDGEVGTGIGISRSEFCDKGTKGVKDSVWGIVTEEVTRGEHSGRTYRFGTIEETILLRRKK